MSEHSWLENAGEAGRAFSFTHSELLTDLDISTETTRESLVQEVFYNEKRWASFVSKNPSFDDSTLESRVSLGPVDILNPDLYLEVKFDESGNLSEGQEFQGTRISQWIPNIKPEDGDTVIMIDSLDFGVSYYMKSWLSIEAPTSRKRPEKLDLEDFFGGEEE